MRDEEIKYMYTVILCTIFIIMIGIGSWIFQSYMEAKAFNNVTGKNVSVYDAMFIELRVQEEVER